MKLSLGKRSKSSDIEITKGSEQSHTMCHQPIHINLGFFYSFTDLTPFFFLHCAFLCMLQTSMAPHWFNNAPQSRPGRPDTCSKEFRQGDWISNFGYSFKLTHSLMHVTNNYWGLNYAQSCLLETNRYNLWFLSSGSLQSIWETKTCTLKQISTI